MNTIFTVTSDCIISDLSFKARLRGVYSLIRGIPFKVRLRQEITFEDDNLGKAVEKVIKKTRKKQEKQLENYGFVQTINTPSQEVPASCEYAWTEGDNK